MSSNNLASLLVTFVRFLLFFLEAFFISSKPYPGTSNGERQSFGSSRNDTDGSSNNGDGDDEHFSHNVDDQTVLEAAFQYFEIDNPKEATREAAKKKFRRLSLVHHPDRNNGSEESVKEMQKINRYYELLEQEFDRREGKQTQPDAPDTPEDPNDASSDEDPYEPGISSKERKRRKNVRRKARKRAEKRQQEEYEKRRKEMEEEMKREWEEARRRKQEFARRQYQTKQENIRKFVDASLDTAQGRDRAHANWESAIQEIEMQQDDSNTAGPSRPAQTKKPANLIMDCSTDDIAVALRLGETDIAIELIHDSMQSFMAGSINIMIHQKMMMNGPGTAFGPTEEDQQELFHSAFSRVLAVPMDDDGNHALFYAVYYEDNEMLSYLTNQARRLDHFAEYITSTNHWGSTVLDFCVGSSNSSFKSRVEVLYKEGRERIDEREEAEARENNAMLLWQYYFQQLREHANLEPALFSVYGILLGSYIFSAKWYETLLALLVTRLASAEDFSKEELCGIMIVNHCWWFVFKSLMSFTRNLLPKWVMVGAMLVAGCFFNLGNVIVVVPSVLYVSCSVMINLTLQWFASILPQPKNKRLAVALDVAILCSGILLIRYLWGFCPSWTATETLKSNFTETTTMKAWSDMTPMERSLARFEAFEEEETSSEDL